MKISLDKATPICEPVVGTEPRPRRRVGVLSLPAAAHGWAPATVPRQEGNRYH